MTEQGSQAVTGATREPGGTGADPRGHDHSIDLDKRFDYHAPDQHHRDQHQLIRDELKAAATVLDELLPECREKSTAITKLEEAMFWANAAIAREGK